MEVMSLRVNRRLAGELAAGDVRSTPTIAAAALRPSTDTEDDVADDDDAASFFDLELADHDGEGHESDEETEFNLAASPERSCSGARSDLNLSPSDDLFFKGRLLPLHPDSQLFTAPVSKSKGTKLRVLMLGFKKPRSTAAEAAEASPKQDRQRHSSSFFVKFRVEEVPIMSLFTRDSSSRSSNSGRAAMPSPKREEKRPDALQRYLSKIKPLYVRVSKRYGEKMRFSGQLSPPKAAAPPPATGLKLAGRRLGKSRSASAAVAAVRSPPVVLPRRRDDSLLEQQDGIQSAIAHCKRSFNGGRGEGSLSPDSPLP